jgi:hypothetical protein
MPLNSALAMAAPSTQDSNTVGKNMKASTIRRLHRWLGLIFSLSILASALSGVIHTLMARNQPPPPAVKPSGYFLDPSAIRVGAAEAIKNLASDFGQVGAINLRMIGGEPWYQIYGSSPVAAYVSAKDGRIDPSQDEKYGAEIASRFLGGVEVRKTDYLTSFNKEYLNIFRVHPVYRFDADDASGTRVYVSTTTGSVTRYTNDKMQFEANIFTNFHKLAFISNRTVRDIVLVTLTGGTALAALAGIVLFFYTRRK